MKTEKQKLKSKALKLWYEKYLKESCEICGSNYVLQGHHFYFRSSYPQLMFLANNHTTLCRSCHFVLHHRDAKKIEEQIILKRGQKWHQRLKKEANQPTESSYQTIEYYQNVIKELEI